MKKLFAILALCLTIGTAANAQWYLGGTGSLGWNSDYFELSVLPKAGYEFNDMMAVEAGLGFHTDFDYAYGKADAWFRFTPWNNGTVYIDLLAGGELYFSDYADAGRVGVRPQLRFRIHPQVDFGVWAGLFGATYDDLAGWNPAFLVTGTACGVFAFYRF